MLQSLNTERETNYQYLSPRRKLLPWGMSQLQDQRRPLLVVLPTSDTIFFTSRGITNQTELLLTLEKPPPRTPPAAPSFFFSQYHDSRSPCPRPQRPPSCSRLPSPLGPLSVPETSHLHPRQALQKPSRLLPSKTSSSLFLHLLLQLARFHAPRHRTPQLLIPIPFTRCRFLAEEFPRKNQHFLH